MDLAGYNGLIRGSDGRWLMEFTHKIGDHDALHVEMWNIYTGMQLAKSKGFTRLVVESDTKLLVDMVTGSCKLNRKTSILIRRIRDLTNLQWRCGMFVLNTLDVKAIEALIC
ncbi:ribonuclease H protein [Trifolium medium]|uniref:Ribonuclease H protein n=1 Tax=Trifolium medium TaxID=97028 RepID=A0A392M4Y3_9FABA|nr:ribonuclease H protein [Trifolium medium]